MKLWKHWHALLALLLTLSASVASAAPAVEPAGPAPTTMTKDKPFGAVAAASPGSVAQGSTFKLRYTVYILDGEHYLYKERMGLKVEPVDGVTFGPVQFSPEPEKKFDTFESRDMEIFHKQVTVFVDATVAADAKVGPRSAKAVVNFQGCNPSVCFFPTKVPFTTDFQVVARAADAGGAAAPAAPVDGGASASAGTGPAAAEAVDALDGEAGEAPVAAVAAPAPEAVAVTAPIPGRATLSASQAPIARTAPADDADPVSSALKHGLLWTFVMVFGLGILASLTPCIYPIIPITLSVLGARKGGSTFQGFLLALVYVLGLSVVYTALGTFAAVTGGLFGGWMQSPWVIGTVSVVFMAMGIGMMGAFNVALPYGISSRLSQVQGSGHAGAFMSGAVAGLVASPCVGPILVSLLTYIAQTRNVGLGAALMFTFAFGMGQLFLVLGTFAVSLPKSGAWMEMVKDVLALVLFGMGLYYMQPLIPGGYFEFLVGMTAIVWATVTGAFHALTHESDTMAKARKVIGVVVVVIGIYSLVAGLLVTGLVAPELSAALKARAAASAGTATASNGIQWHEDFEAAAAMARQEGKPILLDFTADWCAACKELEHNTYTDARVITAAQEFVPVKLDGTTIDDKFKGYQERFGVKGLPAVLFLNPNGEPVPSLTVTGFVPPDEFLRRMCQVEGPQASRLTSVCQG